MDNKEFKLKFDICISEKKFFEKFTSNVNEVKLKVFKRDSNSCKSCSFQPIDDNILKELDIHVYEYDENNPQNSKLITLCKACHPIQHIDVAINNGWVNLVNSIYSQSQLIQMCRLNTLMKSIENGTTRHLKKTGEEFLKEFNSENSFSHESKIKFILTTKFWTDVFG